MYNMLNFFKGGGYLRARIERMMQEENGEVFNNIIGDYTIDSCRTFDEGYETAIWKDVGQMIIVENYANKKAMEKGHKKWCDFCKNNPKKAYSVQLERILDF